MSKPVVIDLFCGLGGWTRGFLAEGWDAVGFDIERHEYAVPESLPEGDGAKGTKPIEKRGWTQGCAVSLGMEGATARPPTCLKRYPAQLVLQDVLTLHGSQFRHAAAIVASPPCQEFSKYAMPFGSLWLENHRMDDDGAPAGDYLGKPCPSTRLFQTCFRLQREASEAAGRPIPMVIENVKGAQRFVGRAAWHYGSYYLWGDVPALMPHTLTIKRPGRNFHGPERGESSPSFNGGDHETRGVKGAEPVGTDREPGTGKTSWFFGTRADPRDMRRNEDGEYTRLGTKHGGDCFSDPSWPGKQGGQLKREGVKQRGSGPEWFDQGIAANGSRSSARKAASAMIAEIPFDLAQWIARCFKP